MSIDRAGGIGRRMVLTGAAVVAGNALTPRPLRAASGPDTIRIGYQKSSILAVTRAQKRLERRFPAATIDWREFQFGPPLLEAMNAGRIDYGYTGNAPPIFAQAARANFLYVGALPGRGTNVGILVATESGIQTVADLKGRRVAVGKGSSGHDYLVTSLDGAGLPYSAIEPVYLSPADGAAAFARGAVAAWSIWDPYLAIAETARPVRPLPPTRRDSDRQDAFFLAAKAFVAHYPDAVRGLNDDVRATLDWARDHRPEATSLYSAVTGIDPVAERRALDRASLDMTPMTAEIVRTQQGVADRFQKIGLIPERVDVASAVWH